MLNVEDGKKKKKNREKDDDVCHLDDDVTKDYLKGKDEGVDARG